MTEVAPTPAGAAHDSTELEQRVARARRGGSEQARAKLAEQDKLMPRARIARLFDAGTGFVEDGLLANNLAADLPADGVVTGIGTLGGGACAVMANDPSVKAGSWGARTVEKIVRILETAERLQIPMVYLVDSAGARITDQVAMFPGRRHAGRIFRMQVRLSGQVPQVCVLFGPSAAGGAYIPAFCDVVLMVEGHASMYLGSPRMAEVVVGEKVSLEEMGGARMHCSVSGCGDLLAGNETEAIAAARQYLSYMPRSWRQSPPRVAGVPPAADATLIEETIPAEPGRGYDVQAVIKALVDDDSFFEIKRLFARELVTGLARIDGRAVGIIASQPRFKGGVLFIDSADKAARFITCCDAFNIPLLFLADVPGFMIGTAVERQGIIRHGAKMIAALSQASVAKICVVMRKAYGAGLYAMAGPAFDPDCTLALPSAQIAVMGPEAAVNAVYYNRIHDLPEQDRAGFISGLQEEYRENIDIYRLADELIVDAVVAPTELRGELVARFTAYASRVRDDVARHHGNFPT
ncbi:MAG: acyl-CoA carboxylase subunit beta [Candidatus Dormibacteraeota bacterium]|uniref:Acyl-CoA carboxylase subunit beta n=1 Tax=Candidatus Amunia macphersoniae TaxID=3127014 RepID=A0A934KR93_9BACT|nr:acyl-CoA carboxylase subunit beta [Candidatus Dormibacteraeota bacterium]